MPDDQQAMAVFNRYLFFREHLVRAPVDWLAYAWSSAGDMLLILRRPGARGARGALSGYRAVLRHLRGRRVPEDPRPETMVADGSRSH